MQAVPLNESLENSQNTVRIKFRGSEKESEKQLKVVKVGANGT